MDEAKKNMKIWKIVLKTKTISFRFSGEFRWLLDGFPLQIKTYWTHDGFLNYKLCLCLSNAWINKDLYFKSEDLPKQIDFEFRKVLRPPNSGKPLKERTFRISGIEVFHSIP